MSISTSVKIVNDVKNDCKNARESKRFNNNYTQPGGFHYIETTNLIFTLFLKKYQFNIHFGLKTNLN